MSDAIQFDPADLQAVREAVREEVRRLFSGFQQEHPSETFYAFCLYDYVDWSCPSLGYAASTLEHWKATPPERGYSKVDLPDDYYKWSPGNWKLIDNLDGVMGIIEKIIATTGQDYLVDDDASELQLSVEAEMMLALHDLDAEGVFGQSDKRNALLLSITTEDEGAADDWRYEISAYLLNPEDVFRTFLVEFRRGNRQDLTDIDAEIQQLKDTDLARRFYERLQS